MSVHRSCPAVAVMLVAALSTAACGTGGDDAADGPASTASTSSSTPAATATTGPATATSGASTPGQPTTESLTVPAPALEGNLLGDPAELDVSVWLPPSYGSGDARYPVVYFLAGFREAASTTEVGNALATLVASGDAPEMILVGVGGLNSLGGSFYVDSPVTGEWATAVHRDVVQAVDSNYRTVADRDHRGIAGFSMGGFGALDLAMRHPDVFGAVYALAPGLLAPGDLAATEMFAAPGVVERFLDAQAAIAAGESSPPMSESVRFAMAYGSAFAPDVDAGAPWIAYPYTAPDAAADPAVWARWEAGYGGLDDEVATFHDELASLRGIALDYGTNDQYDWIPRGTEHLAGLLAAAGIDAEVTSFEGGHGMVGPRAEAVMLPFFARALAPAPSAG